MSDEPDPKGQPIPDYDRMADAWQMPEPVFRSSEGVTPKTARKADAPSDIDETPEPNGDDATAESTPDAVQLAAPVSVRAAQAKPKKGGCAKSLFAIAAVILVAVTVVVLLVVYWYYSTPAPDPFN